MTRFASVAVLLLPIVATSCASFSSTSLRRLDDNSFIGASNGPPECGCSARPYKGVPITLEVPSHVDVYIDQTYYMQPADHGHGTATLVEVSTVPILSVRADIVKTKKVFIVDLKRPASGTLDASMSFNEQQYFDQIKGDITDTTLKDTTALIATVLKQLPTTSATKTGAGDGVPYLRRTRVLAYRRFDLNVECFEQQVHDFVACHLNCGNCPAHSLALSSDSP
jgi:hypothetical protein